MNGISELEKCSNAAIIDTAAPPALKQSSLYGASTSPSSSASTRIS